MSLNADVKAERRPQQKAAERRAQLIQAAYSQIAGADAAKLIEISAGAKAFRILAKRRGDLAMADVAQHIYLRAERRLAWMRRSAQK
jgi:hypothetical protein